MLLDSIFIWFQRAVLVTATILLPTIPASVSADDSSLYDAPLPDDAAYLRFIGFPAGGEIEALGLSFSGERISSMHYNVIHANITDGIEPGQILTAIPDESGNPLLIAEPQRIPRKITLQLVNLSDLGPVSLTTEDGAVEIIAPTARSQIRSRDVNPIRVSVVVRATDSEVGSPIALSLRPNQHTTFVVISKDEVQVVAEEAIPEALP